MRMEMVRPRGWGFLMVAAICADALQFIFGIFLIGVIFNTFFSVFFRSTLWIWHTHNDVPSNFGHALVPMIAELIPIINVLPFWTLYAATYWVEEEETQGGEITISGDEWTPDDATPESQPLPSPEQTQ